LTIAVNVSPHQLSDPAFADDVCRAIEDNGLRPGQLCIEVTESALMDEPVVAAAAAHLHGSGAPVAIDDFGTGYSSFRRLKVLAIDFLKIDQSFVAGIGRSPDDEVIISTMVTMARSLGVAVIAEGIETAAQHDYLAELGCEYGQGYLWSPAVDEATATELIESERSAPTPPT
jgi:EAL domain-containing protein (putative c-di-GMP-specific phosphodiesterase class I)